MGKYCRHCGIAAASDKSFCGQCGAPLELESEVEVELRRAFEDAPTELERMDALLTFLNATGRDPAEERSHVHLMWCHARLVAGAAEVALPSVLEMLKSLPVDQMKSDDLPLVVDCVERGWLGESPPLSFVEALSRVLRNSRGAIGEPTHVQWGRLCLRWSEEFRPIRPSRASALLEFAATADPTNQDIAAAVVREKALRHRALRRNATAAGAVLVTALAAFSAYRYLHTADLVVYQQEPSGSTPVSVFDRKGRNVVLRRKSAVVLMGTTAAGTYTIRAWRDGFAGWESTLVLRGRTRAEVAIPPLAPVGTNALSEEVFAEFRRSGDPILEYVNFVHNADHQGAFKPIVRAELASVRGTSILRGFSNMDEASHAGWASVWTLEAGGEVFEIDYAIGPAYRAQSTSYQTYPAAYVESGNAHQGIGWSARTWLYGDGHSYRFHTVSYEFDNSTGSTQSPDSTTDGELKLKGIRGLSASTTHATAAGPAITDTEVTEFVTEYLNAMNSGRMSLILAVYDRSVDYYKQRGVDQGFIEKDKSRFYSRWKEVSYTMNGPLAMGTQGQSRVVEVPLAFRVYDPERHSGIAGTARNTLELTRQGARIVITSEDQRVLTRSPFNE